MIVDLSHTLKNEITVYPGTSSPIFEQQNTIEKNGFAELSMTMYTHTGTHIDAPAHIIPNAKSLNDFPIDKFIGNAIVVDCSEKKSIDLEVLNLIKGKIEHIDFILFYTGWQEKCNTPNYFD